MAGPRGRQPYPRRNLDPFAHIRRNERVRAPEVRVIGPDGRQLGIMTSERAFMIAKGAGLDLVEVAPQAQPPVCRILDFGKYKYEEQKKQSHAKTAAARVKEVKLRARIEQHDYLTKMRRAELFLHAGNKLKVTLQFRGRELAYQQIGFETMRRALAELGHVGTPDNEPRLTGRQIIVTMTPLAPTKRKLKLNPEDAEPPPDHDEPEDDDDDDDDDDEGDEGEGGREGAAVTPEPGPAGEVAATPAEPTPAAPAAGG